MNGRQLAQPAIQLAWCAEVEIIFTEANRNLMSFIIECPWHRLQARSSSSQSFRHGGPGTMVTSCANPACNAPFHYFRSGKIFSLETEDRNCKSKASVPERRIEYFWVCGKCLSSIPLAQLTDEEACVGQSFRAADPRVTLRVALALETSSARSQRIEDWDA